MKLLAYILITPVVALTILLYLFMVFGAAIMFLLSSAFHSLVTLIEETTNEGNIQDK